MVRPYSKMTSKQEMDTKPVDAWTIVHAGVGMAAGLVGVPMLLWLAASLFWEAFENWKRPKRTLQAVADWTPELDVNLVLDVVANLGGWGIGAALASRGR